ncbi:MAG: carbohydrate binding family 9 domain-containing protein [Chitinophagaceae bacterium]|nr:carbohydrate binding family 9 domain-containing protein [Chitinophagaceae bacterium]
MNSFQLRAVCCCMLLSTALFGQTGKKSLAIKKTNSAIKIDGILNDAAWKAAPVADQFVALRPVPFMKESGDNASEVHFLYDDGGVYIGGYFHEKTRDSIAAELIGRDGFGNNDFVGIIFDTYQDKLNGFEYFVTPLGEQMDAKVAPNTNGNSEDFSWNAVWQSAAKIHADGWSFEMFIPYSAIRFGKKKMQDWGLNIVRRRQKSGQQLFWQPLDPNVNGFLTQEGTITGLENIKPPMRLQLSPYLSAYYNHDGTAAAGTQKTTTSINGGMDVKYGLNQAFTLDMTLIPDFGQVQSDNRVLNLTPFEQKFSENRAFFTEGTELFNKGNLFYSRRIGGMPLHYGDAYWAANPNESVKENPAQSKLINATKISGRTQKGLGVGVLNAITKPQFAIIEDINKQERKFETDPLTNYNVFVLDQTMKNNSSISFVNTNVWRSGHDYDANVSSLLFDLNDKKNTWNVGGNVSFSNLLGKGGKNTTGYAHSIYFGKTSGRFNFNVWQELSNDKYDKSDLGYFTNNNTMDQGIWAGYNWTKPRGWFNQKRLNANIWYSRLVSPIDVLRRQEMMYQNAGMNINFNGQTKKLWWVGFNINGGPSYNDFYEPRYYGKVFRNKGRIGLNLWWESNFAKKFSWNGSVFAGTGGVFKRKSLDLSLGGKIRFNSKFSIDNNIMVSNAVNQPGWAANTGQLGDTVIFSRRNVNSVEDVLNIKYNFTNKMGLTLRARHFWTKVRPVQFYELDKYGNLQTPTTPFTQNVNQNYNYLSMDLVYNWQFAQGSFFSIVWKDIAETFDRKFEKNYVKNLGNTVSGSQFNSLSVRVIYFLDYLTFRNKLKRK